jgi:hypothetical protein
LEDYLAGSFVVFNTKFNTTSTSFKQNNRNWYFDHSELKIDEVFANASYTWNDKIIYNYYFTAAFE